MSKPQKSGGGLGDVSISVYLLLLGMGYWWLIHQGNAARYWAQVQAILPISIAGSSAPSPAVSVPSPMPINTPSAPSLAPPIPPSPVVVKPNSIKPSPIVIPPSPATPKPLTAWEKKPMRGIYLSRYQVTNNASEQMIRDRVRYYKAQGINTIIQGVWGNGCTMYDSNA
jgi:hypothetical protein